MVSDTAGLAELLALNPPGSSADIRLIRDNQLVDLTVDFGAEQPATTAADGVSADAPGQTAPNESKDSAKSGSLLGGFGSVLGGMFNKSPTVSNPNSKSASESVKTVAPPTEKAKQTPAKTEPAELLPPALPSLKDVLALEPEINEPAEDVVANPPSEKDEDSQSLKTEIQRLRDQLKSLEDRLKE